MVKASDFLIALDDGHGSETAGKRTPFITSLGRQIRENEFNKPVVNLLDAELKRCGFRTLQLAPTDADVPLNDRVKKANDAKANLVISIHYNAMDGKFDGEGKDASGFSAHINPGSGSRTFANTALKHLAKGTKQINRGVVEQNLAITRDTKMHAVLIELGFMDNEREALLMLNSDFQREVAKELAVSVCEHFKVPYVEAKVAQVAPVTKGVYRIKTGAFPSARLLADAKERVNADFPWMVYEVADSTNFNPSYRLVTGTFSSEQAVTDASKALKDKYGWVVYIIDETPNK